MRRSPLSWSGGQTQDRNRQSRRQADERDDCSPDRQTNRGGWDISLGDESAVKLAEAGKQHHERREAGPASRATGSVHHSPSARTDTSPPTVKAAMRWVCSIR